MLRVRIDIAYVGTHFAGWQVQPPVQGIEQRTVQGELEKALAAIIGKNIRIHSSGRTDAGVHADKQVAHFDVPQKYATVQWVQALQRHLPEDICVLAAQQVSPDFHARFDATSKIYVYNLWLSPAPLPPKLRPFVWASGPLDLALMDAAACQLEGKHDFAAFQNSGSKTQDTTRNISHIRRFSLPLPGEVNLREDAPLLAWEFCGNGFLKQMVRNLVGFMVACGQKKLRPTDATTLFATKKRTTLNFVTAPACGLSLRDIFY